jgi:hypothetical protein
MFSRIFLFHVLSRGFQSASSLMCFVEKIITIVIFNIRVHKWRKMIIISISKLLSYSVSYIVIPGSLLYLSTSQIVIYFTIPAFNGFMPKIMTIKTITKYLILIPCCRRSSWWSIFFGKPLICSTTHIILINMLRSYCGGRSFGWRTLSKFDYVGKISDLLLMFLFLFVISFIFYSVSIVIGTLLTGEIDRPSTGRASLVRGCLNNPSHLV